jgi:apolipoprotein N-acyltransferase
MTIRRKAFFTVLAALLVLLSMPGYPFGGAVFVALVPLFFALHSSSLRQGFWLGWLCGFLFFALIFYWIYALYDWAGLFTLVGHLGLAGLLGLSWGIFGLISVFTQKYLRGQWLAVPAVWVLLEYLRSLTKFGFTWGYLSDALYQYPEMLHIASLTGTWGLSFLIVLSNFLLYRAMRECRVLWGVLAVGLLGLNWSWGAYQLNVSASPGRTVRIAIIHSNVDQRARSDPSQLQSLQNLYFSQLDRISASTVDLVILPESILPAYLLRQEDVKTLYTKAANRLHAPLIVGTIDYRDGKLFNTAALISADGRVADLYDKVQLVPFSTEYFPLIDLVRSTGVENLIGPLPLGALTAGQAFRPLKSTLGQLATPICFESIFSQIGRAFVRNGAQALLVITNDAWFKGSRALEQHFAKAVFRAVETGRYTVQAANGGISGVIDPQGRIRSLTRSQKELILQEQIVLQDHATLYVQLGDWVVYLLGILFGGLSLWALKSRAGI